MPPQLVLVPSALILLAAIFAVADLVRTRPWLRYGSLALLIAALTTRVSTLLQPGMCPINADSSGSLIGMFLALHLIAAFRRDNDERVRTAVQIVLILAVDSFSMWRLPEAEVTPPPADEKVLGVIHGGLILIAYSAFFIGALYGLLYLALYRLMKRRRLGFWFSRLPSLERLEGRAGSSTLVGLAFLTVGLGLGLYSYFVFRGGVPYDNAKFVVASLVWLLFASEVYLRRVRGRSGVRVTWIPVLGAVVVVILNGVSAGHPFWSPP